MRILLERHRPASRTLIGLKLVPHLPHRSSGTRILLVLGEGINFEIKSLGYFSNDTESPSWMIELANDYIDYYSKTRHASFGLLLHPTTAELNRMVPKYDAMIFIGHGNENWGRLRGVGGTTAYGFGNRESVLTPNGTSKALRDSSRGKLEFIILESCNMLQNHSAVDAWLKCTSTVVGYAGHESEPLRHQGFWSKTGYAGPGGPHVYRKNGDQ